LVRDLVDDRPASLCVRAAHDEINVKKGHGIGPSQGRPLNCRNLTAGADPSNLTRDHLYLGSADVTCSGANEPIQARQVDQIVVYQQQTADSEMSEMLRYD